MRTKHNPIDSPPRPGASHFRPFFLLTDNIGVLSFWCETFLGLLGVILPLPVMASTAPSFSQTLPANGLPIHFAIVQRRERRSAELCLDPHRSKHLGIIKSHTPEIGVQASILYSGQRASS